MTERITKEQLRIWIKYSSGELVYQNAVAQTYPMMLSITRIGRQYKSIYKEAIPIFKHELGLIIEILQELHEEMSE
jgi:hypothetical protein